MKAIIVCNTASDSLSIINLEDYSIEKLPLELGEKPVGPHGICYYDGKVITANNYANTISVVDLKRKENEKSIYVGAHPTDIKMFKDKAYILCGESNILSVIDMVTEKLIFEISVGMYPHSIEIDEERSLAYVVNMEGHSVSVIDCISNKIINTISTPEDPTKILLSKDKKVLYLCESYLGKDRDGCISIISTYDNGLIKRIKVCGSPVDMCEEDGRIYCTNFEEGSFSIVDIEKGREIKKVFIGGMPRGIIKDGDNIFIGDNMNNRIVVVNLKKRLIKTITIGKEPNAMILLDYQLLQIKD